MHDTVLHAIKVILLMSLAWWISVHLLSIASQFISENAYRSLVSLIITPLVLYTYTLLRDFVLETKYKLKRYRYLNSYS